MIASARDKIMKSFRSTPRSGRAERLNSEEDHVASSRLASDDKASRSSRKSLAKMQEKKSARSGNSGMGNSLFSQKETVVRLNKDEIEE